ncbi:MAG: tungstate ABC transporter substrate-binding protein WtpA [bacterium]
MKRIYLTLTVVVLFAVAVAVAVVHYRSVTGGGKGVRGGGLHGELIIFHAGSLSVPFRELGEAFRWKHPGVTIRAEAAGSRHCARKISDLGRRADVLGSADYKVVQNLLMPEHADFNIRFATNEMAIAYSPKSRLSGVINARNWHKILLHDEVRFGRADPNSDPCGYRSVMVFQLAEKHYGIPGLAAKLTARFGRKYIRPKETDLLSLLEAGEIDYLFIYRSVAAQHGLKMVLLADEVNLKSPKLASLYRTATVRVTGKKPGQHLTRTGESMVYSVTIPKRAPHRELAEAFVAFLLSPTGQKIIEQNGQPFLRPVIVDGRERLPKSLEKWTR